MLADKTTLTDLSIFHPEIEQSIFHYLNFTQTNTGKEYLRQLLSHPLSNIPAIENTQKTIQALGEIADEWPASISNGTLMVLEKFYETPINNLPHQAGIVMGWFYRVASATDYSLTKYTIQHAIDFTKGMAMIMILLEKSNSSFITGWRDRIKKLLQRAEISDLFQAERNQLTIEEVISLGNFIRNTYKSALLELIDIYYQMDAYMSMAEAGKKRGLQFPTFTDSEDTRMDAEELFHILLPVPVPYTVSLNKESNFIFLTGANMAGKSTFIKAIGIAAYLAHIGMGVPAKKMTISLLHGIVSNIQITDNIIKGESFFYNEVQRIKSTLEKVNTGFKWLILIDELFKGTNQEDAIRCSTAVMEGLRKNSECFFVISTHLYEIGETLTQYKNIQFNYFETSLAAGELAFSYQLKPGISNDRLGYLILQKEGVLELLNNM
ncbi:MAG: DNA mismatch repair protein MutS [Sediminibacterium sp.]|nr:DNA mismatch repair protein MutS [Sediminibacterium sp.]